ncbi:MAG: Na/Pi cotransporter family protein [Verrucomicrobium sp.]|nr:Na/Pi cotransporter family protein [Verrucomicrobium sp.]
MLFFQIAGGIALVIFGVRFLRKGLDRLFGGKLVLWLSRMTQGRWKAFGSGVAVGTLAPSSTALSLLTLQLIDSGRIDAARMLAVLLGTNLGITVMAQFLAFHVQSYAGVLLVFGVIGFQFLHRETIRGIGQCLLSFGFIFVAMQYIGAGVSVFLRDPANGPWITLFSTHPLLVLVLAALFTVAVQSSTVSISFAIALAANPVFAASLAVPWVLGTNLGISVTGVIMGWNTLEGRRLTTANLMIKGTFALLLLFAAPSLTEALYHLGTGSVTRHIAVFHSLFNLLVGLLAMPFLDRIVLLVRDLLPAPEPTASGLPAIETYLDPQALETPSVALANATRETLRMTDAVKQMLASAWRVHTERNLALIAQVQQADDLVDGTYRAVQNYLSRIREGLTKKEAEWQFALLTFSNELESVGDIIDKSLCDQLRKHLNEGTILPAEEAAVLRAVYERVMHRFDEAIGLLTTQGAGQVRAFLRGKETLNEWCRQEQKAHYERLKMHAGHDGADALAVSAHFLDMLDSFRRINSHVSTIGYSFTTAPAKRRRGPAASAPAATPLPEQD